MAFDINETLASMGTAAGGVLSDEAPGIADCVKQALQGERTAIERIAVFRLRGEIDDEDMQDHLRAEKVALEVALRACNVRSKIAAERAANAAIAALESAVKNALMVV